jgi:hypothetical protein
MRMKHKVTCASCEKKGIVEIDDKTKKILTKEWWYYFKVDVNGCFTNKYFYTWPDMEKRILNPKYDPEIKKKEVEVWYCPDCHDKP